MKGDKFDNPPIMFAVTESELQRFRKVETENTLLKPQIECLEKENEQFKQENERLKKDIIEIEKLSDSRWEENERLRADCGAVNERCYVDEMKVAEEEKAVLGDIKILPLEMSSRKCLNCGTEFLIHPYVEQDFCNNCFHVVCKAVFDKSNGNLTCKQLVEKLRGK